MKQRIENKMNEYIEHLLSKPQLASDEYLILKDLHKELAAEEHAMRKAEARARKMNDLFDSKGGK